MKPERGDGKLNKNIRDAVQEWHRKAVTGIGIALSRMRLWQKAGLILCIVFWILSFVIGVYCDRLTAQMKDQNFASRWTPGGGSAQISTFISDTARISEDSVSALNALLNRSYEEASIVLSQTQIDNGAKLIDICYCGFGTAELSKADENLSVTAIGVGGDFFNFHPLELMDGYYFSSDDLMKDRILLDDETAWRLFGSPHIAGQIINVGGAPHVIAGVFKRPEGRFYKSSGMGNYLIFVSYDTLCRYTTAGNPASENSGENDDDSSLRDAKAVPLDDPGNRNVIPSSAAWAPAEDPSDDPSDAAHRLSRSEDLNTDSADSDKFRDATKNEGAAVLLSLDDSDEDDSLDLNEEENSGKEDKSSEKEEEDADDSPAANDPDRGLTGRWGGSDVGEDDPGQKQEIDKNRITCIEAVLPNPISGYALRLVRSVLSESGVDMDQAKVVDNTARFNVIRLITMLAEPGVRSMQTAPIRYPYWENVSLAWEDVLIPYALLQMLLRYIPVLFLLFTAMWYATHKSWTAAGIIKKIQDRIYDRQSERIYGKRQENISLETGAKLPDSRSDQAPEVDPEDALRTEGMSSVDGMSSEDVPETVTDESPEGASAQELHSATDE